MLLDEQATLTAIAYGDLNPTRAKMAETLEGSAHTSVAERMTALKPARIIDPGRHATGPGARPSSILTPRQETYLAALPPRRLLPFDATNRLRAAVPFAFEEYLDPVEIVGRCQYPGKRGLILERVPALLQRLEIAPSVSSIAPPG